MQPLVSIGMPVFNCEGTLRYAVKSILNQTHQNWELILLDDGSRDKTLSIAQSFKDSRIKIIADGLNLNLPNRLNQAIALSKGKYFARMDGDDVCYPERLQTQVEYLEKYPHIDLLATHVLVFGKDGCAQGVYTTKETHAGICSRPWAGFRVIHPTWMGKTEWFRTYQYQPKAVRMEDYEILFRAYPNSCFHCLPKVLLGYRLDSLSLKKNLTGRYNLSKILIKAAIQDKKYLFAYGVLEQGAKALVDIFAVTTGLNLKLARHRSGLPVDETELIRWQQVWNECNKED
jgi:glycosyltransferase involved in cell wall biosynthesis